MEKKIEINKKGTYGSAIEEFGLLVIGIDFEAKEVMEIVKVIKNDETKSEITDYSSKEILVRPATEEDFKNAINESTPPLIESIASINKSSESLKRKLPKLKHFICCDRIGITTNDTAECRICGKKQTFDDETILDVVCPECGKKIIAVTNQKDMKFFMCGNCKTHIDVEYDYKTNKIKDLMNL